MEEVLRPDLCVIGAGSGGLSVAAPKERPPPSLERHAADLQLRAALERYRVGAASFIELQEAETIKARADRAYLASLYQFHESLAALEAAIGRSLTEGPEIR